MGRAPGSVPCSIFGHGEGGKRVKVSNAKISVRVEERRAELRFGGVADGGSVNAARRGGGGGECCDREEEDQEEEGVYCDR